MLDRRTAAKLVRVQRDEPARITEPVDLPSGLPPWLTAFVAKALQETDTLRENGADQAAAARVTILKKLLAAAAAWLDADLNTAEAAHETGWCEETIRRAVRDGTLPDRRGRSRGRIRVRRGDLEKLAAANTGSYDPTADAQSIAKLRRKLS